MLCISITYRTYTGGNEKSRAQSDTTKWKDNRTGILQQNLVPKRQERELCLSLKSETDKRITRKEEARNSQSFPKHQIVHEAEHHSL